ncbi:chromosomal replication initiator protein DnaA [Nocardia donostiensis]|uniref:Chromosomal replication initiator protein DnaA n=1 Tax=Nocardia donostiensis TaxID=1538463 RepID=A0A1W0AV25_9NOCA|nr:chromosomal replication initiator protein DnaA [Nocardia donostiensis]ONM49075.1 chromosomal replication initiation protein DnaA [Nocardia donostiensis]OQS14093.1 chromosomal replication initiation protein DnaA [Nocardia donostiensis]OQS19746.1 chromosomal replication initiation protein DnaA [Nocardia donostiensis]
MDDEQNVLATVWPEVVAELTTGSADGSIVPVTRAQQAWLKLVKPLTVAQGFALLSVPSSLAQEAIERDLREPILRSLGRRLGPQVEGLGVRIAAPTPPTPERAGGAPRHARLTSRPERPGDQGPGRPTEYSETEYTPARDYPGSADAQPGEFPRETRYSSEQEYPGDREYSPSGEYGPAGYGEYPGPGSDGPAPLRQATHPLAGARHEPGLPPRRDQAAAQESLFAPEPLPLHGPVDAVREQPAADDTETTMLSSGHDPVRDSLRESVREPGAELGTRENPGEEAVVNVRDSWPTYFSKSQENTAPATPSASLNAKYTFETFVIGASNRFAHAAAVAIAEAPARAYNPLFVWGASGLGKTHLLHAAGHYAQRLFPGMRVKYVSTEEFTNDFINSLRDDRKVAFKRRYRETDILLVDDIQFIEGKEGIQEEFFHTFNTLHNANKQIVVSSDRPPKQLATLEERLRTRFEWGLITDVQPPELETRIAILRKKARMDRLDVPHDVLELIASRVERNIRELEGALIRVTAFASLNGQPLDQSLAEVVLRDLMPETAALEITAATIMAVTAEYFNTNMEDLTGPGKARPLAQARQIAMYLCRELTDLSLPKIGQAFGRDHTTVMYAEKKVRKEMTERRRVYDQVQELTARIKQRSH